MAITLSAAGKTAIITGAAGGLGKVIAETFLKAGANVAICDVNQQRLSSVEKEWSKDYSDRYLAVQADVTSEESVQSFFDKTVAKFGRVGILVNVSRPSSCPMNRTKGQAMLISDQNAGIMDNFSPVGACEKALWDKVLAVNLTGPFITTKHAVIQMEKQSPPGGSIINIGSNASWRGMSSGVAYTVSKTGLLGLTKNTAGFYGPKGIYCQCLMLGAMMDTNIAESMMAGGNFHQEMYQAVSESQNKNMKTVGLAGVAKYVLFLTDDDVAKDGNGGCVTYNGNWPEA